MNDQRHISTEFSPLKPLGRVAGLIGISGIVLAFALGVGGYLIYIAISVALFGYQLPPDWLGNSPIGLLAWDVTLFASSAVPFVAVVLMVYSRIVRAHLAHSAWRRWAIVTIAGSFTYWGILILDGFLLAPTIRSLNRRILPTENSSEQLFVLLSLGGLGAIVGLTSGAALGIAQWVVLRQSMKHVGRWATAVIITGNALFIGLLLPLFLWGTRWWN